MVNVKCIRKVCPVHSVAVLGISPAPGSGLLATVKYYRDQARGVTPTVSREYQVEHSATCSCSILVL